MQTNVCFITKQIKKIEAICEELENFLQKYQEPLEILLNTIKDVNKKNWFSSKTEVKILSYKNLQKEKVGLFQLHS